MPKVLITIMEACKESSVINIVSYGLSNLLQTGEFDMVQLRGIYRFLQNKEHQEKLLFRKNKRISTYVGTESQNEDISATGIAVSRYAVGNTPAGAFAVIAPMRMNYALTVAYTDYISQMCGKLITELIE